jgi:SIR2-like domain
VENQDFAVERLNAQMARGEVVLFTGAGFSAGATNAKGEPVPQGTELKRAIWDLIEPGEEPGEGSTLADTYAAALAQGKSRLTELLRKRLQVAPDSLTGTHELWLSLPWRRAYTLNIDDLEIAATRKFELPNRIVSHSGLHGQLPNIPAGALLYTHLNGTLDDVPDVTFADPQYGQRHLQENPLYRQLTADLLSYTVVFVGTEIRESLFWQYIAMRDSRGTRGVKEMRPASFLVTPQLPKDRQLMLATFNIRWICATADEFASKVLAKLGTASQKGHLVRRTAASKSGQVDLPLVSDLASIPDTSRSEYLMGAEPTWDDIRSGRAIERQFEREQDLSQLDGCVVITGTAGAGTSTALKRLALRLTADGQDVRWIGAEHDFDAHDLSRVLTQHNGDLTVVIDDADTFGLQLRDILRDLKSAMPHITLILGMRVTRLDHILGQRIGDGLYSEINVPLLEDSDIELLLMALEADSKLGALKQLTHHARIDRIQRECNRELLVAMIEATSGERFELKVTEEFDSLEAEQKLIYAVVAIATELRFGLTKDEVLIASGDVSNTGLFALDRLLARRLLSNASGDNIRIRHRRLAEVVANGMRRGGQLFEAYHGLANTMAMRAVPGERKSRNARLLTALIAHSRIGNTFAVDDARAIYDSLEELLKDSYHYWLQRGAFEVQYGNIRHAGNYLQQAKAGGEHDYRVETEWAYYLLKSAYLNPDAADAHEKVEEGKKILLDQIDRRGSRDVHVWHVYGSQILAWTRQAQLSPDERAGELEFAKVQMDRARMAHPHARKLQQLHDEIEREWLMTRVPPEKQ